MKRANWTYFVATALVLSTGISVAGARSRHDTSTIDRKGHLHGHWGRDVTTTSDAPTTTQPATTTTQRATTTTAAPTTTTVVTTTTLAPPPPQPLPLPAGAFMSYPLQPCTLSINGGTNVVVSNKSFRGCRGVSAIVVSNATNVYLHDLDFDGNSGDIFIMNSSGQIRIENIRARNTGAGRTTNGSGQGEVIQLNNTWDNGTGGIRNVKSLGGNTEDAISIYKSGGVDSAHPLVIENNHIESPLPPDGMAWSSGSGTCINSSDDGSAHVIVRNNTVLSCGQAGIIINVGSDIHIVDNVIYGAARSQSNVGLTQWAASPCACSGNEMSRNRVWWVKSDGTPAAYWISGMGGPIAGVSTNVLQDPTINPGALHVVL